jgi:hypothetical protein
LYLQTRSLANVSQALSVYFGVHEAEAASGANSVASAISGLIKRARSPLTSDQVLTSQGTRRATISSVLNSLPETGQRVSSERTFEALDEIWGAIAATLLSDSGFSLSLYLSLPLNLVNHVFRRRDDVAALVERVQGIQTVGEIYGLIHRFKESAIDREYLYEIIGIPESLVDQAAVAPRPVRQACEACHEDPFDRTHPRPPGLDATQAEWRLALELAQARNEQAAWDTAVQVLVIGGSIGAALLAGAATGGLGWVAVGTAAAGAAGLAAAGTSSYEIYQAGVTEEIASGAHAAADLYPEFGLGSEGFLVWAERNLEHTKTAATGNILVAIATAPIPGAGSTVVKKVLASMLMGGLDGLCGWMVDPRVNQADFLIETHVLAGGTAETAPTPGQTLVMSIGAGALFGGLFEAGIHGAGRLYFHVDLNSGHTKVRLQDGTDVTAQLETLNQQLRAGTPESKANKDFIQQVLDQSRRLEREPLIPDLATSRARAAQIQRDGGILLQDGHRVRIINGELLRCTGCAVLSKAYRSILHNEEAGELRGAVETILAEFAEYKKEGLSDAQLLAFVDAEIKNLDRKAREFAAARGIQLDGTAIDASIKGKLAALGPADASAIMKLLEKVTPENLDRMLTLRLEVQQVEEQRMREQALDIADPRTLQQAQALLTILNQEWERLLETVSGAGANREQLNRFIERYFSVREKDAQLAREVLFNKTSLQKKISKLQEMGRPEWRPARRSLNANTVWQNPRPNSLIAEPMTEQAFTERFGGHGNRAQCSPYELRFGQEGASFEFDDPKDGTIDTLAAELYEAQAYLGADRDRPLPAIQIYFWEGFVWTNSHRRLIAAQNAGLESIDFEVIAMRQQPANLDLSKLGTSGATITIRGGKNK